MSRTVCIRVRATRDIWTDKVLVEAGTEGTLRSVERRLVVFDRGYYGPGGQAVQEDVAWVSPVAPADIKIIGSAGANVCTAPRRTVRVPAVGQQVQAGECRGVVKAIVLGGSSLFFAGSDAGRPHVLACCDKQEISGWWLADDVAPIGDDPRWIEITLPEQEPF